MPEETTLQKAYRQSQLWPPIHAAVDVFLRRRAVDAEPYELTWRLIHVWECVVLTLVQTAIAKLMADEDHHKVELRIIREKCYGVIWEESEATIKRRAGAFDGSMDKWIEILEYVSTIDASDSPFLASLKQFLNGATADGEKSPSGSIDLEPFTSAWARACDIPPSISRGLVSAKNAFKVVNSFRNRLAHVPFPYDPISDVYRGLERCTEELFSTAPKPTGPEGALSGCIAYKSQVIKGATPRESDTSNRTDEPAFIFEVKNGESSQEKWSAKLFIHIDNMLRPYILTRLKDDAGLWEYTRYLAESNAVVTIRATTYMQDLPIPSEFEYLAESEDETSIGEPKRTTEEDPSTVIQRDTDRPIESMGDAISAIQTRRFAPAIEFLTKLLMRRVDYHVGWLRLGHARREYAVDLHAQDHDGSHLEEIRNLLESSLKDFAKAQEHISAPYKAEAHYHASKSHFRLCQYLKDKDALEHARLEAEMAAELYPDSKYDSWDEYLGNVSCQN